MARGTGTAGRIVKKRPRKAAKPRRPSKTVRRSSPSTASTDDLREQLNEALAHQAATAEVLRVISRSPGELKPVFESMLANAMRICEAQCGFIYRMEDGVMGVMAEIGVTPAFAEYRRNHPTHTGGPASLVDVMRTTKKPAHVHDARESDGYRMGNPNSVAAVDLGGARTALYVPMLKEDEIIGAINLYRQEVRPFTDKQIELVQTFAAQAVIAIENARLLSELRQRTNDLTESLEQQTATSEVLKVISSSPGELEQVFRAMLENAVRICGAHFGVLFRFDGKAFHADALRGVPTDFAEELLRGPRWPTPESGIGRLAKTKKTVHIPDVRAERAYTAGDPLRRVTADVGGVRTFLAVPMLKESELVGAILIYRQEVRPFTDRQIDLVSDFAAQAVIAIENARLLNELRQRTDDLSESLEQQTATSEVLQVISSSPGELEPIFNAMLANATRICEAKFGNLLLFENGVFRRAAIYGAPPDFAHESERNPVFRPNALNPISRLVTTKQAIHVADMATEQGYLERDPVVTGLVEKAGLRTAIVVPMLKESELIGAIGVYRQEVRPFTEKQIELLKNFAAQAVIAIENARLLNELRRRTNDLSEALEQQTATGEILKVISTTPGELEPVFNALLDNAARICEAKFGSLYLYDGDAYHVAALHNAPPAFAEARWRNPVFRPPPETGLARLPVTRQTDQVSDMTLERGYIERNPVLVTGVDQGGFRTVVTVPMLKDEKLVGCINFYRQEVRPFTDKQIALVENFAAQAVIAIENTRLLNQLRERTDNLTEALEQQTATSEVLQAISSFPGKLEPVFQAMLENATRICEATFGNMLLFEGDGFRRVAMHNAPPGMADLHRHNPVVSLSAAPVLDRIARAKQVVHLADVAEEYPDEPIVKSAGARSFLVVPMLKENELIGVIGIYRQQVRPFTDKQITLVQNFAAQAVIAIENTRLLNELRQRTDDLSKSLEDLRTTQDRLVQTEKLASLGQLTAGIAHEIKNPLNFVNNFSAVSVELIDELRQALPAANLDDRLRAEISEIADMLQGNLEKVVQHGRRADSIVKNMLQHSRQGSGEHRLVDINAIVEESLNLAYHGARAETRDFNITLDRSLDPAAGEVDVFPQDITRVLLNLISNGFYAATKRRGDGSGDGYEPILAVVTRNLGDRVEIRIRDNGTGIPPEVKDKIFNPFFTTKPAGEGTGLGLSISHDIIVKQHAGSIEVDSQPGEFTEFRITLPRTAASLAKSGGEHEPTNPRG